MCLFFKWRDKDLMRRTHVTMSCTIVGLPSLLSESQLHPRRLKSRERANKRVVRSDTLRDGGSTSAPLSKVQVYFTLLAVRQINLSSAQSAVGPLHKDLHSGSRVRAAIEVLWPPDLLNVARAGRKSRIAPSMHPALALALESPRIWGRHD